MLNFLSKKWEVVGDKKSSPTKWWKYKNALIYADEMNKWHDIFGYETFTVRRIGEDQTSAQEIS